MRHVLRTACLVLVMAWSSAVTAHAQTLGVPATVTAGGTVTVTVSNGPGNISDWLGLYPSGTADVGDIAWTYLNDSHTRPSAGIANATVHFTAPATAGTYNVRIFSNDSWTKLATSADFTVQVVPQNYLTKYASDGSTVPSAIYESGGNVGIGTSTPAVPLDIDKSIAYQAAQIDGEMMRLANTSNQGTSAVQLSFQSARNDITPTNYWIAHIKAIGTRGSGAGSFPSGQLVFYTTRPDGESVDNMRILANGNVGIGTATPTAKLHVAGDLKVDGNIAAKYQDVAEWVDSVGPLEAGMIVVIDRSGDNRVSAARQSYDLRVAGAVSASPGVILGEPGSGKVLVAQSGRVRIRADASYGAIQVGDLLVSSPTAGAAMRSEPIDVGGVKMHRPGTLIGKALEPLDEGTGEILVLLTLQ